MRAEKQEMKSGQSSSTKRELKALKTLMQLRNEANMAINSSLMSNKSISYHCVQEVITSENEAYQSQQPRPEPKNHVKKLTRLKASKTPQKHFFNLIDI